MTAEVRAKFRVERRDFTLDVDLSLPGRGITALFGHSGSGKTTCLRAIAGLERAPAGYLEVGGEVWQDESRGLFVPPHRRALGVVFQEASLFPHLSVRGNMEFGQKRASTAATRFALPEIAVVTLMSPVSVIREDPPSMLKWPCQCLVSISISPTPRETARLMSR